MLRHVLAALVLCGILTLAGLLSPGLTTAQVLDRVEIVETPNAAEIHIVFNTTALYLRHTPSDKGDLIRIFLDFPDLDRSRRFARELAASPPSDLVPKFSITFPDRAVYPIRKTGSIQGQSAGYSKRQPNCDFGQVGSIGSSSADSA
jgi:hypothetical protein